MVLRGVMPGNEIWETGFWMSDTGVASEAAANALAQIIWGTITANDTSGAMRTLSVKAWKVTIKFTEVRTYVYTGGTTAAYIGSFVGSPALAGSSSGAILSNQTAMCLSLRTGLAGRRNRGRMYLPVNGLALNNDAQWDAADLQTIADGWRIFMNDVNASDTGKIVVVSRTATQFHPITGLILDSRPDVIRRRANQQLPTSRIVEVVTP